MRSGWDSEAKVEKLGLEQEKRNREEVKRIAPARIAVPAATAAVNGRFFIAWYLFCFVSAFGVILVGWGWKVALES
jgi:hypothetical protein